jgi:hypothetical protein
LPAAFSFDNAKKEFPAAVEILKKAMAEQGLMPAASARAGAQASRALPRCRFSFRLLRPSIPQKPHPEGRIPPGNADLQLIVDYGMRPAFECGATRGFQPGHRLPLRLCFEVVTFIHSSLRPGGTAGQFLKAGTSQRQDSGLVTRQSRGAHIDNRAGIYRECGFRQRAHALVALYFFTNFFTLVPFTSPT